MRSTAIGSLPTRNLPKSSVCEITCSLHKEFYRDNETSPWFDGEGDIRDGTLQSSTLHQRNFNKAIKAGLGCGAGGFQIRNPIPLKIRRVLFLLHVKSYVGAQM
ncbi:hypothetical protein AVEN_171672-1 [Araneus ventricosus]|uniref:Uncharacterized protein n=1 Tax=Araneus ventricosus TaxID=182803 RepID=A0A4Y2QSY3_ARAVE|nr:hypothetical protein AVEN_250082-1 [Araneus ventricosus]GBN66412.1 hypothetical protein AVEN_268330-1 [Araneus ventricosus]GBN66421.1 hypothetical protein AVEN_17755-1 [Araneus ventricosus]GBN66484.1 hypothetical protein AVEN_171672-1 [Araneus ventricosus]